MTDSPLKPVLPRNDASIPATTAGSFTSPESIPSELQTQNTDAAQVSVPRATSKNNSSADPRDALDSLLQGLGKSDGAAAAHSGLDASRVFSLLDDE